MKGIVCFIALAFASCGVTDSSTVNDNYHYPVGVWLVYQRGGAKEVVNVYYESDSVIVFRGGAYKLDNINAAFIHGMSGDTNFVIQQRGADSMTVDFGTPYLDFDKEYFCKRIKE